MFITVSVRQELFLTWFSAVWIAGIVTIAFYGDYYGWFSWTWLPMLGYTGAVFGLCYLASEVRRVENRMAQDPDQKTWLSDEGRTAAIMKVWKRGVKARNS